MRTLIPFRLSMIVFASMMCIGCTAQTNLFQQESSQTARVWIEVDAIELFDFNGLEPNWNDFCRIWDNQGHNAPSSETKDVKDLLTDVYRAKNVHWEGLLNEKSEDEGFTIELLQIEILGENCLFDKVRNPGKSGKVKARVKDADEVINCKSRYSIFFRITNSDGESLYFNLDPFLRGKS